MWKHRVLIFFLAGIFLVTMMGPALASISEPDVIYYGTASGAAGSVVSIRLNGASAPLDSFALGTNLSYKLRVPMDAHDPRQADTARTGDTAFISIDGVVLARVVIPARGSTVQLELAPQDLSHWNRLHPGDNGSGDLNRNGKSDLQEFLLGNDPASCVWTAIDATHGETTVYHEKVLVNCLMDAESDVRHNLIRLAQGKYYGNFTFTPNPGEDFNLTITGGYDPAGTPDLPGTRSFAPNLTILSGDTDAVKDGIGNGRVFNIDGVSGSVTATLRLEGLQLQSGKVTAAEEGGGLRAAIYRGKLELVNNVFTGCEAVGNGGALALTTTDSGELLLAGNVIHANKAALGAALKAVTSKGTVTLLNNTLADNQATENGDGQAVLVLVQSSSGIVDITNNIISGTLLSGPKVTTGAELFLNSSGVTIPYSVRNNNIDAATAYVNVPGFTMAASNLTLASAFVDPAGGNYHLQVSSPLINKGYTSHAKLPATDLDGEKRLLGTSVDMGADEIDLSIPDPNPSAIDLTGFADLTTLAAYPLAGAVVDNSLIRSLTITNASNSGFTPVTPGVGTDGAFNTTVDLLNGLNILKFVIIDFVGYKTTITRTITLDSIQPTVTLASTATNPTKTMPLPVTAVFSEAVTGFDETQLLVVNATVTAFSGSGASYSFNLVPSGQGPVTVNLAAGLASDAAGNFNLAATELARTYDTTPPGVVLASTAATTTNVSPLPITITFSEAVTGFNASRVTVGNGTVNNFSGSGASYSFNLVPTAQGAVTINVAAGAGTDAAGNSSSAALQLSRTYDISPPGVVLASTALNPTRNAPLPVTVTFAEAVSGFDDKKLVITNGTASGFSGSGANYSFNVTPAGQGEVTVNIAAGAGSDASGNQSLAASQLARIYDTVAPAIANILPTDGIWTNQSAGTVSGLVTDVYGVQSLTLNDASVTVAVDGTFSKEVTLAEGANQFALVATDSAGNSATIYLAVNLDTILPSLQVSTLPDKSATNNDTLNISGIITDAGGPEKLDVNGTEVLFNITNGSFSHLYTLAPLVNTITVTATDKAGNQLVNTREITLDQTLPALTVTAPADNGKANSSFVVVKGTVDENCVVEVKVNGGDLQTAAMTNNEFTATVNLVKDLNTIDIRAVDLAGNASAAKRSVTYDVDKPTLAITEPLQDITTPITALTLKGTVSDALSSVVVSIVMDNATYTPPLVNGVFEQQLTFSEEKNYQIIITATDEAGNATSVQRNVVYGRGGIIINKGAEFTASTTVTLDLKYQPGAAKMQFLYNNSSWGALESFVAIKKLTLPSGDGVKTIQVRFMDAAGNLSGVYADTIILDTLAPTGGITINNGAEKTETLNVTLKLTVADVGFGTKMQFSNDKVTWSTLEPFAESRAYTLVGATGTRSVSVRFKDVGGKVSAIYTDSIIYTTTAPPAATSENITINRGNKYTASSAVTLNITNPGTAYTTMSFSSNASSWTTWESVKSTRAYNLATGDGIKSVYVRFRTAAGVISGVYSGSIVLDTVLPTGAIIINGGSYVTTSAGVQLKLAASDINGIVAMQFSDNGTTWKPWEPYGATRSYTLTTGDGQKRVYARYMDAAGKVSTTISASILLDTTPPVGSFKINNGAATTTSKNVTLTLAATGGAVYMQTNVENLTWSSWEPIAATKTISFSPGTGERSVQVRYRDTAGNVSAVYSAVIYLFQ